MVFPDGTQRDWFESCSAVFVKSELAPLFNGVTKIINSACK